MLGNSFGVASKRIVTSASCARTGNKRVFWDTNLFVYLWEGSVRATGAWPDILCASKHYLCAGRCRDRQNMVQKSKAPTGNSDRTVNVHLNILLFTVIFCD